MEPKLVVDTITAIGTAATALFTSIAAWLAWKTVREAMRTTTRGEISSRKVATIHHLSSCREDYLRLPEEIESISHQISQTGATDESMKLDKARTNLLLRLFTIWEHISAGINAGVYDIEVFNQMTGSRFLSHYREHAQFVRRRRREEGLKIYDQLDLTIDRLLAMWSAKHLITGKTLRKLRANFVDPDIRSRLKGLQGILYHNYKELSAALVDQGVEREKNLISAYSRFVCIDIQQCKKDDEKPVVELFAKAQKAIRNKYNYNWPPVPGENRGELDTWVFKKAQHHRNYVVLYREPRLYRPLEWIHRKMTKALLVGFVALEYIEEVLDTDPWSNRLGKDWKSKAFSTDRAREEHELSHIVAIRRLVVDPDFAEMGIGRIALRHAIRTIQEIDFPGKEDRNGNKRGKMRQPTTIPVALIPVKLKDAIQLCHNEGGLEINEYNGAPEEGKTKTFVF
jgi:hypothetical protein